MDFLNSSEFRLLFSLILAALVSWLISRISTNESRHKSKAELETQLDRARIDRDKNQTDNEKYIRDQAIRYEKDLDAIQLKLNATNDSVQKIREEKAFSDGQYTTQIQFLQKTVAELTRSLEDKTTEAAAVHIENLRLQGELSAAHEEIEKLKLRVTELEAKQLQEISK